MTSFAPRVTHLVAHRGNARDFPENTIPALTSALALGLRFLEFDVQLSADEVPVIVHDADLARTAGISASVFDLTAAELVKISVGESDRFGERFADVRLPLLSDVVALLAGQPHVTAFVELKRQSLAHFGAEVMIAKVLEALRPVRSQCVLISFDLGAVHLARKQHGCAIGWVLSAYDAHSRLKFEALAPEYLFVNHERLPPAPERLWRGPWRWAVYEVTTVELAVELASRGADFIETMAAEPMSAGLMARAPGAP